MNRIKWLILAMFIAGVLGNTAYAGDEIASPPSDDSRDTPSLTLPLEGEGRVGAVEALKLPDVVAAVSGHIITKEDVERQMARIRATNPAGFDAMGAEEKKMEIIRTIDSMILREALYQEAVRKNISVTDDEIDRNLEVVKSQFASEGEFEKVLSDAGLTLSSWRNEAGKDMKIVKVEDLAMNEIIKYSDSEIADYYEKNKKDINKDTIKVSHILVKTEEEAREIIEKIKENEDFAGLAKRYSIDLFTKDEGGNLGWYSGGELLKEVEDAAFALSQGQVSGPVKSEHGYHIIRLDEKKAASEQTLEDQRERVMSVLQQVKWQKMRIEWLKTILNKTVVWRWSSEEEKADK